MNNPATISGLTLFAAFILLPTHIGAAPYMSDAEQSRLEFSFNQAGARNSGQFTTFSVDLALPAPELPDGRLEVLIDVGSLDSRDGDRDSMLRSAYFFESDFFPEARFESTRIVATGEDTYAAVGQLTIRDTTREIELPFVLEHESADESRLHLHGSITIRRLDFGIGQGEWRATTWIRNDVQISYSVRLQQTTEE